MMSSGCMAGRPEDRDGSSRVYRSMVVRLGGALLVCLLVACGGGSKKGGTTPGAGSGSNGGKDPQSMQDTGDPGGGAGGGAGGGGAGGAGMPNGGGGAGSGDTAGGPNVPQEAPVTFPNLDPDPAQAKSQVDQQLAVAKQALMQNPPDADGALRASKAALAIDASSVDAAAYVGFAYYHKKQYDTAELVLDELFKRPTAKQNANVFYVYGLVYDHTNRLDQALLAYQKAVAINPSFASALVNLGVHQLRNKQYGEAQTTFEKLTKELGRNDAVTLTSLGSAYRGRSGDYGPGSAERNQFILAAEAQYKRALAANANYGPAYYNLALLYLDSDPFPSGGGSLDTMQRLNASKTFLDQYKNMPGVDIKMYDDRIKDVTRLIKRAQKQQKKSGGGSAPKASGGGSAGGKP
jgi:tetratricopeptide (TPR) repeat protein